LSFAHRSKDRDGIRPGLYTVLRRSGLAQGSHLLRHGAPPLYFRARRQPEISAVPLTTAAAPAPLAPFVPASGAGAMTAASSPAEEDWVPASWAAFRPMKPVS